MILQSFSLLRSDHRPDIVVASFALAREPRIKDRETERDRSEREREEGMEKKSKENENGVGGREETEDAFRESKHARASRGRKGDREGFMNEIVTCCAALR